MSAEWTDWLERQTRPSSVMRSSRGPLCTYRSAHTHIYTCERRLYRSNSVGITHTLRKDYGRRSLGIWVLNQTCFLSCLYFSPKKPIGWWENSWIPHPQLHPPRTFLPSLFLPPSFGTSLDAHGLFGHVFIRSEKWKFHFSSTDLFADDVNGLS